MGIACGGGARIDPAPVESGCGAGHQGPLGPHPGAARTQVGVGFDLGRGQHRGDAGVAPGEQGRPMRARLRPEQGRQALGVVHLKDVVKGGIRERFDQLRRMGIRTVICAGIFTDQCVSSTVRSLADESFHVVVVEDCCAAGTMELHTQELAILNMIYCHVMRHDELLALMTP